MKEQQYILKNAKSFELKDIFDCGQCFRWNKESDESYTGVFKQNVINVKKKGQDVYFKGICSGDIKNVVTYYFDLERDYENIKKTLSKVDINMKTSIEYGKGIRILNQDLWETIISFIISANNNIPRIKGIIEKLSKTYGNEIIWNNNKYYTFPSVNQLKDVTIEQYRKLGLGFRDIRLYETTQMILNKEIDLEYLKEEKDTLSQQEKDYVAEYLIDIEKMAKQTEEEVTLAYYLPKVVEEAVKLHMPGIFIGDVIQEGNVSLMLYLGENKKATEAEVLEQVRAGIRVMLESHTEEKRRDKKMVERVNDLDETIKSMKEEYGRKVSVDEVAERMGITEDTVEDILKLAGEEVKDE